MTMSGDDDAPNILFWVVKETLSDNSETFAVELPGGEKIPAADEDRAGSLAEALSDAVNEWSETTAGVMY